MSADQVGTDTTILFTYEEHIEMCELLWWLEQCDFDEGCLTAAGWQRYGALNTKWKLAEEHGAVDYYGNHPVALAKHNASEEVQSI
jgi:hypothetical protein